MTSVNANHNRRPLSPMKTPFRRKTQNPDASALQILRTSRSLDCSGGASECKRSLDYSSDNNSSSEQQQHLSYEEDIASAATSLNSSFDAALGEESKTIFRTAPPSSAAGAKGSVACASWDNASELSFVAGRKHRGEDEEYTQPIGTVRKQPRRSSSSDTPCRTTTNMRAQHQVRILHQPTPGSSSRRRKATPLQNRKVKSPYQHHYTYNAGEISPHATPLFLPQLHKNMVSKTNTCQTGTTFNSSSLDLTCDITEQSHESPVSTPFRFTSFPASLPRVNPRASQFDTPFVADNNRCPQTTRKKMNFSTAHPLDTASVLKRARVPMSLNNATTAQDETAQTSSLSSMSGEQQNLYPSISRTFDPPSTLDLGNNMSNSIARRIDTNFSDDSDAPEPRQVMPSGNLFLKGYSYDDGEEEEEDSTSPLNVSRTRLDFNVAVSSKEDKRDDNACLSPNITKPIHRTLEYPEIETTFVAGSDTAMITTSGASRANTNSPDAEAQLFLSRLDAAQCSPILPYKDETEESSPVEDSTNVVKEHSCDDSTSSSKQRRLRPMPDMSAFDGGASSASIASLGNNNNKSSSSLSGDMTAPKLTCPPTPVRTPAWAHINNTHNEHDLKTANNKNPFLRSNSLIVTKVLATAPLQASSAEAAAHTNSSLEYDSSAGMLDASDEIEQRKISLSFSTVDEDEEMQDDENISMTNHSTTPAVASFPQQQEAVLFSFTNDFENLGPLGKGSFADVYKVRCKLDQQLYAVKRNRRQFRGKRDREMAMAEVRTMQKLQGSSDCSIYILSFYRAWQEEGYFYCQTALCCRDTCRELLESLRSHWPLTKRRYPSILCYFPNNDNDDDTARATPASTLWKICHDVVAGLVHIHSHNIVHHDIKPDNIFFVLSPNQQQAICKIGDFGMAGDVGTAEYDGQEGDTVYMAPELLSSCYNVKRDFSADIFSLGLTLYELASPPTGNWELPAEGPRWHELRNGKHVPVLDAGLASDNCNLVTLIQSCIGDKENRPAAQTILTELRRNTTASSSSKQQQSAPPNDLFLRDYICAIEALDRKTQQDYNRNRTPRTNSARDLKTPSPAGMLLFTDH
mmetsp:Transcript_10194/g.14964  ORF Transcript_10194/g.14964 Transcript_10194/m.14964 type:complete len:1086 (+) Transcript_10194:410-3667(+)|eukprot:CAMPEP_0194205502 /NCGR_PEP_ID=MMETSP0156-20130528/4750_1 /TAXON_ID=33649 /ORGANISM="Thalassionema nitzschioides, Strain L26-B" /LENGTH=1085 /DNA_ID=CAMNT_0038931781 /DNA_START=465 /DNA_END=3722 /DNA_ORIENTATION=-